MRSVGDHEHLRTQDIAVVGVGCRFPGGVRDLGSLWTLLCDGGDVIGQVPRDRWDDSFYDPDGRRPGTAYGAVGGFLDDITRFDSDFFGISPREARAMDPQQRLLLEVAWEAMEDSGVPRERWDGTSTGTFVGILNSDYGLLHAKTSGPAKIDAYYASGKEFSFAPGRIAYTFGLRGPSLAVNTACSSSLTATHLACSSLRSGECDTALAGGVNLMVTPELTIFMCQVGAISPTGRCRPFDARSDGIVRGEGCAVVVLKRLGDAVADGDRIHGVIRGSAVNHDGRSAGLTVPSAVAQEQLLRQALRSGGLTADQVAYVEAHGTGTPLGDPIEIGALGAVYGAARGDGDPILVGSLKANFGHMDSAAGIAGLLKALLVVRHGAVPPQIHLDHLTPQADWQESRATVAVDGASLPDRGGPAIAGVSAFGLSGTNAHLLVQAPEPGSAPGRTGEDEEPRSLVLSAPTAVALRTRAEDIRTLLTADHGLPALDDVVHTAANRRTHHEHRLVALGDNQLELAGALDQFVNGDVGPGVVSGTAPRSSPPVVFVFSGQGSQWPGMGLGLARHEPVFQEALAEYDSLLRPHTGWSLLDELAARDGSRLHRTGVAQPAIFAVQVALARLWRSWGVEPQAVIGHSMGEIAAAVVAEVLSPQEAAHLVAHRGRLLQETEGTGAMVAVESDPGRVAGLLAGNNHANVVVATVNGPRSVVISGPRTAVEAATGDLRAAGADCVPLPVEYAFHSHLVHDQAARLQGTFSALRPRTPSLRLLSTVDPTAETPVMDAAYWGRNVSQPVLLWPAIDRLLAEGDAALVELGVHPVLSRPLTAAMRHRGRTGPVVGSLVRGRAEGMALAAARARLHVAGVHVDWSAAQGRGRHISLPPHPWGGDRHWLEGVAPGSQRETGGHPVAGPQAEGGPCGQEGRVGPGRAPAAGDATADGPQAATEAEHAAPERGQRAPRPEPGEPLPPGPAGQERLAVLVQDALGEVLGYPRGKPVPRTRGFFEMGLDSMGSAQLCGRLSRALGVELAPVIIFEHPQVDLLAAHLSSLGAAPQTPPQPAGVSPVAP